jgi:glycosyltransferase involved in cell wall biosynthesis
MRLLVHDYSGHPFQVDLSRALARRGHDVLHVHCTSYRTGKGAVDPDPRDPPTLRLHGIEVDGSGDRYAVVDRCRHELAYGQAFVRVARSFAPDVVLSSNDPLLAKCRSAIWCRRSRTPWIFWLQDLYSVAMARYTTAKLGWLGSVLGAGFQAVERRLLHEARSAVLITDDFAPTLRSWRVPASKCTVIENWAPLQDLAPGPKDNPWAREHGLVESAVLLYSGTLGLKHDVEPLVALAEQCMPDPRARVVVVSEGPGADHLQAVKEQRSLDSLLVLPYQPFDRLPEVFATADVLVALLSKDAGAFSVPSKILSYLCAGRPILAALPGANLAARTIERASAGVVVEAGDRTAFLSAAQALLADAPGREAAGRHARAYAERTFDIERISDRFEELLTRAAGPFEDRSAAATAGGSR